MEAAAWTIVFAYFFALSWRGLLAFFTGDDLTNIQFLHGFGQRHWQILLAHVAIVATPEYRPFAGLIYRTLFGIFGLHPLGFRIFCYAIMALNLVLAERLCFLLTRSRRASFFAVLLFTFHPFMADLYFNTGTLYDLVCFSCGIAALICYIGGRRIAFFVLYGLALDSKEMAITWPAILVAWELILAPGAVNLRQRLITPAIAAVMALLSAVMKVAVPNAMSNSLYKPHFSLPFILEQTRHYYLQIIPDPHVPIVVPILLLLTIALLLRNRAMVFGVLFAVITLLPVSVIPGRSGFVWYIPLLGWALYGGAALGRLRPDLSMMDTALLACMASGLYLYQRGPADRMGMPFAKEQNQLRALADAQLKAFPTLPRGSRLLIAEDQFSAVNWLPLFLMRLAYKDPTIWVDRVPQAGPAWDGDITPYRDIIHAANDAVQIEAQPHPPVHSPVAVNPVPRDVNRGMPLEITLPAFAGCAMDVEYRMPEDELARSVIVKNWCTLDKLGKGDVTIGQDVQRGVVQLQRVRFCGREWLPAAGAFTVVP